MAENNGEHRSVLLDEAVDALRIKPQGVYIDGTFGRGGHSSAILERLGDDGRLLALDQDPQAIEVANQRFVQDPRFEIEQENFESLRSVVEKKGVSGRVDGILLDIGVSSPQLDDAARGFSFSRTGPLDMRMNPGQGESAAEWLARVEEAELARVLWEYGEEKFSRRIARAIVEKRQSQAINETGQLAGIIADATPVKDRHKHPATRSFQAIRIHINRELEVLEKALEAALDVLALHGRLVVISFHSLEDRIVKRYFRQVSRGPQLPKDIPIMAQDMEQPFKVIGKAIKPGKAELDRNPRARSSVMRVLERVR